LGAGEIGYETDTGRFKIGTGAAAWASLGYFNRDPLTTKGDLYTFSTTDDRLAVGANGETLVADSSATTGLRYTATPSASNPVINSAFQVWQRGTSISLAASTSIANSYTADRFQMPTNANQACTVSRQATGDSTNLPSIQYCGRFQRNSGQTGTGALNPSYNLETLDSIRFAGKIITFSFYARAGANYSNASNSLGVVVVSGTGTDQNLQNGYTSQLSPINSSATLTTTWQRFTFTSASAVSSTATQLGFYFPWAPVGTAGVNDYFEITGIQIDVGSVALPFRTNGGTIQGELAACQRYYVRYSDSTTNYAAFGLGQITTSSAATLLVSPQVSMRVKPSSIEWSGLGVQENFPGGIGAVTSLVIENNANNPSQFWVVAGMSGGFTAFQQARLIANNTSSGFLGFNAEL
jgi:hypothetical protein